MSSRFAGCGKDGIAVDKRPLVYLKDIVKAFQIEVVEKGIDYEDTVVTVADVTRPGLQIVGYFDYFDPERLQILGMSEMRFLSELPSERRRACFDNFFAYDIPALVYSRNNEVYPECLECARKYGRTILRTPKPTVQFTSLIIEYLNRKLATKITRHGVLLDIYGEGVFIMGDSGVGKSETALELIKRGHRLVADDAVEISKISDFLLGTSPELIRHYIEVRGVGVVNVRQLFGMSSIKTDSVIDLVVYLEKWDDQKVYDRLGLENNYMNILDVDVPKVTIPVSPGRNLSVIIEVAAMNNRQKKFGYNAARELVDRIDKHMNSMMG